MNINRIVRNLLRSTIYSMFVYNDTKLARDIIGRIYRTSCFIDTGVYIKNKANFSCGNECALYHCVYILNTYGTTRMGNKSHLGAYTYVNTLRGHLTIGNNVCIGPGCKIFTFTNHFEKGTLIVDALKEKNTKIGSNVLVGSNSVILAGTVIEDNVVLAAGSVANGTLETNSIYGGTPAKKIRSDWY